MIFLKQQSRRSSSNSSTGGRIDRDTQNAVLYYEEDRHWQHQQQPQQQQRPAVHKHNKMKQRSRHHMLLDPRALRFGNVLLVFAIVILLVDAARLIVFSIYSNGIYLRYLYQDANLVEWPKCLDERLKLAPVVVMGTTPRNSRRSSDRSDSAAAVVSDMPDYSLLTGSKQNVKDRLLALITVFMAAATAGSETVPQVDKALLELLTHASTAACLLFLMVSILPPMLRNNLSRGLLFCALLLSIVGALVGFLASVSCLLKVLFYCAAQLSPPAEAAFFFVPRCNVIRKVFFCAECFCFLILLAAETMLACLAVFFGRSLAGVDAEECSDSDEGDYTC